MKPGTLNGVKPGQIPFDGRGLSGLGFAPGVAAPTLHLEMPDIEYCVPKSGPPPDGTKLIGDLYTTTVAGRPLVIVVPGGGFMESKREEFEAVWGPGGTVDFIGNLNDLGFNVFVIQYRALGKNRENVDIVYSDMVQDVKCAVRYMRSVATDYDIDADSFILMGFSAGAAVAASAALTADRDGPLGGATSTGTSRPLSPSTFIAFPGLFPWSGFDHYEKPHWGEAESVQALVSWFGRLVLDNLSDGKKDAIGWPRHAKPFNPVDNVDSSSPPALLQHGLCDGEVCSLDSILLYWQYYVAGAEAEVQNYVDVGHDWRACQRCDEEGCDSACDTMGDDEGGGGEIILCNSCDPGGTDDAGIKLSIVDDTITWLCSRFGC